MPLKSDDKSCKARRAALRFSALSAGAVAAIAIGVVAIARFDFLGAGFHVNFALLLGAAGTIALGVGLMALSFYSSRSGTDDSVKPGPSDAAP